MQDVHREYFTLAQQLGDAVFRLKHLPEEIDHMQKKMAKLQGEAKDLQEKEAAFQKRIAEKKACELADQKEEVVEDVKVV